MEISHKSFSIYCMSTSLGTQLCLEINISLKTSTHLTKPRTTKKIRQGVHELWLDIQNTLKGT